MIFPSIQHYFKTTSVLESSSYLNFRNIASWSGSKCQLFKSVSYFGTSISIGGYSGAPKSISKMLKKDEVPTNIDH